MGIGLGLITCVAALCIFYCIEQSDQQSSNIEHDMQNQETLKGDGYMEEMRSRIPRPPPTLEVRIKIFSRLMIHKCAFEIDTKKL